MDQNCEGDEFIKFSFYKPTYKFSDRLLYQIVEYSRSEPPFQFHVKEGELRTRNHVRPTIIGMRGWEIPNLFVMY